MILLLQSEASSPLTLSNLYCSMLIANQEHVQLPQGYVRLGFHQAAQLARLGYLPPIIKATDACLEKCKLGDGTVQDLLAVFHLLSAIGRRYVPSLLLRHSLA